MANQLDTAALEAYKTQIMTILGTEPADGAALITALDTYDEGAIARKGRYLQALVDVQRNVGLGGGQILDGFTIADGGSTYAVGDIFPVTGATSGEDGYLIVDGIAVVGSASAVAVNSGGTGYAVDDVLTLSTADGSGLTVTVTGETGGVIDTVSITTAGSGISSDEVGVASTGGTGTGATFDTTIYLTAGEITSVKIQNVGNNYVGALTIDASGSGDGTASITADNAPSYESEAVLAEAIANVVAMV